MFDVALSLVQMAVLGKIGDQAAAKQIPSAPALGTVQTGQHLICGTQRTIAGRYGFPQLTLLAFQKCKPFLQFQDLLCGGAANALHSSSLFLQHGIILTLTVTQAGQFSLISGQLILHGSQLAGSGIILDSGSVGFLAFFVQLLVHLSDDIIEKRCKATALQLVYICLFLHLDGFQFPNTGRERTTLGAQFGNLCFQLPFPGDLFLKLL